VTLQAHKSLQALVTPQANALLQEAHSTKYSMSDTVALSCRHRHIKRQVPSFRRSQLLLHAVAGWRNFTAAKLQKEQQRRKAVRHHYLSLLARGLAAWSQALQAAAVKQGMLQQAVQQRERHLLLGAWQVRLLRLFCVLLHAIYTLTMLQGSLHGRAQLWLQRTRCLLRWLSRHTCWEFRP
jgi:hypothetical protein